MEKKQKKKKKVEEAGKSQEYCDLKATHLAIAGSPDEKGK